MPVYKYRVRDKSGKIIEGRMSAPTETALREKLDGLGYFLIDFIEQKARAGLLSGKLKGFFRLVKNEEIAVFTWQLYTMLNAGLTLSDALSIITRQIKNKELQKAIVNVRAEVQKGNSFSDSLKLYPYIFSPLYINLVSAGEIGGVMDTMLERLAVYYEKQAEIESRIKGALSYPAFLVVATVGVILFLVSFILPKFSSIFEGLGVELPLVTKLLFKFGQMIANYGIIWLALLIGIIFLFKVYVTTKAGREMFDRFKIKVPLFGAIVNRILLSRFSRTLSTLVSSGVPLLTSLDVVKEAVGNVVIAKALGVARGHVKDGAALAPQLKESKLFPDMVTSMVAVGEETGSLDKMLGKIADFYDREVEQAITAFTKMIEPILLVFMTVIIAFIAVSIFLPMADVMSAVSQG